MSNRQSAIGNRQSKVLRTQHSEKALSTCKLPTANYLPSALSTQHSALSTQPSVLSFISANKYRNIKHVIIQFWRYIIAQVIIHNLEDELEVRLKVRAIQHGRSIEEEVHQILRNAVSEVAPARSGLGSRIAARFAGVGLDEPLPELRGHAIRPMDIDE